MDMKVLQELGLTNGEIVAYTALLELGETKVGAVVEQSGLAASAIHNALHGLLEKGLVSYVKRGKVKHYSAVPPKHLLTFLEEKKQRLVQLLPVLEAKHTLQDSPEAEIFEGTKGIISLLYMMIEDAKKGDEYLFFAVNVPEQNAEIQQFFQRYDAKRKAQGLMIKGIAPPHLKQLFQERKTLRMNYVTSPIPSNISVCNKKVAIFSWGENPVGYLISSEQIAEMYRIYFSQVWDLGSQR